MVSREAAPLHTLPAGRRLSRLAPVAALVVLLAGVGGCGGGDGAPGTLTLQLTDDPIDQLRAVRVAVASISVVPAGGESRTIASDLGSYDLLALERRRETIAAVELEPGRYEALMVRLDPAASEIVGPAGSVDSLRLATDVVFVRGGGFRIEPDGETRILLDFDVHESLLATPDGWVMTPIIRIASLSERSQVADSDR